ncbi:MAG: serine hydrolase domain-containing protein, partial [Bdellovibrionota bacterium]
VPSIRKTADPETNTGMEWALSYWTGNALLSQPGTQYSYSTHGFNLAGVVLEKATGRSLWDLVAARITGPLGMTKFRPDYQWETIPNRAVGYIEIGSAIVAGLNTDVSWKLAGGGYLSTARDMGIYCKGVMGPDFLTESEKASLWTSQETDAGSRTGYGLGWSTSGSGVSLHVSHSGSQEKAKTYLSAYPNQGRCVGVLINSEYADPTAVGQAIEAAL